MSFERKNMKRKRTRTLSKHSKEEIIGRVLKKAGDRFELCTNCAQSTLAALQEEFNLAGGGDIIKAATFMPGIASRKETCGAVVGGLMALGLAYGKDKLKDHEWDTAVGIKEMFALREKAWGFCEDFKKEMGSTMCGDIRCKIMGREYVNYDGLNPKWRERFLEDGGPRKCRLPVETAARIIASIMLDEAMKESL